MTRKPDPIRAPWCKGDSLSCSVFDVQGGVVATIYARTAEEQAKRLHLVKAAPRMLEALKLLEASLPEGSPGVAALRSIIEEAEPV